MKNFLNYYSNIFKILFILISFVLFLISYKIYVGNKMLYFIFFSLFTFYFCLSFNKKEIFFFDLILSFFLWLGFFFKITNHLYLNIIFGEGTGNFDFSGDSFDKVLLVSCFGCSGFIMALFLKKKFTFNFNEKIEFLKKIYYKNNFLLFIYLGISLFFLIINLKYNIYQKGTSSNLEFGRLIRQLFAYYYLIGFPLLTSLIISFEIQRNKFNFIYLSIFETFLTSLSLISRGMIINLIPYILATLNLKYKNLKNFFFNKILLYFSLAIILFIITILFSNTYRIVKSTADIENKFDYKYLVKNAIYKTDQKGFINISSSEINIKKFSESLVNPLKHIKYLIFYRWVGIDAVMAVEATENKNFNFYKSSWMETYEENKLSFYDTRVLNNLDYNLSISNNPKLHVVTLPGFIAHSYYTGSLIFVVLSCFFASILCHLIILCYNYFTNNVFLTAILSNILAYRLVHWGFAPLNTYNLLIGIFGTLLLIVLSNHVAKKIFYKK